VIPAPQVIPAPPLAFESPHTGVEIVASETRQGITYYTMRDLRKSRLIQNVTRSSARRLWQYAITEYEEHPIDAAQVKWLGNIGLWKQMKRAGKERYDLCQRDAAGKIHAYYGVTDDGVHGPWRALFEGEEAVEEPAVTPPLFEPEQPPEPLALEAQPAWGADQALPGLFAEPEPLPETREEFELPREIETPREVETPREEVELPRIEPEPAREVPPEALVEEIIPEPPRVEPEVAQEAPPEALVEKTVPEPPRVEPEVAQEAPPEALVEKTVPEPPRVEPEAEQKPPEAPVAPPTRAQLWREQLQRALAQAQAVALPSVTPRVEMPSEPATPPAPEIAPTPAIAVEEEILAETRAESRAEAQTMQAYEEPAPQPPSAEPTVEPPEENDTTESVTPV
jgi:hypothetical protein